MIYLRARWYHPADGRFQSRDTWGGDANRPMSLNRWNYAQSNPVKFIDPSGHYYIRQKAVQFAVSHDLMDSFTEGTAYRTTGGGTDCAAFASSVLWAGGVRDIRVPQDPYGRWTELSPNYWGGDWAQSQTAFWDHPSFYFDTWQKTNELFKFLTGSQSEDLQGFRYETIQNDADLSRNLSRIVDIGDLVFYGPMGGFGHVAVIVSRSAPQTFFGGFDPHPDSFYDTTTWTDYMLFPTEDGKSTSEWESVFKGEALKVWNETKCKAIGLQALPRVVERSGGILYSGSRSINNTIQPYNSFTIVHIE